MFNTKKIILSYITIVNHRQDLEMRVPKSLLISHVTTTCMSSIKLASNRIQDHLNFQVGYCQ
jgi:hypothetical protein